MELERTFALHRRGEIEGGKRCLVGTAFATGGLQLTTLGGAVGGAAGGFAAGAVGSGGDVKAALQGAFTGGLFGAAGAIGASSDPSRYLAHAAADCVSAAAGGQVWTGGCQCCVW